LLTVITLTNLGVLDLFCGRKNIRLGVNRNPEDIQIPDILIESTL